MAAAPDFRAIFSDPNYGADPSSAAAPPAAASEDNPFRKIFSDPKYEHPKPRSALGEIGSQLKAGALVELPRTAGQALQYVSEPGDSIYETGKGWADAAERRAALPEYQPHPDEHGSVVNALAGGARMVAPSVAGPALVGGALAALPVELPAAVGLGAAAALGSLPAAFAQGQGTLESLRDQGISEEDARAAARRTAAIEWGGETAGAYAGGKLFGIGARALSKAAPAGQAALTEATAPALVKPFVKQLGETALTETGTEIGQAAGQAAVEQAYGGGGPSPWEQAKDVIAPTLGMTALLAPLGLAGFVSHNRAVEKRAGLLASPQTDPGARAEIASAIAQEIAPHDAAAARSFHANAMADIQAGAPITLDPSLLAPREMPLPAPAKGSEEQPSGEPPAPPIAPSAPSVGADPEIGLADLDPEQQRHMEAIGGQGPLTAAAAAGGLPSSTPAIGSPTPPPSPSRGEGEEGAAPAPVGADRSVRPAEGTLPSRRSRGSLSPLGAREADRARADIAAEQARTAELARRGPLGRAVARGAESGSLPGAVAFAAPPSMTTATSTATRSAPPAASAVAQDLAAKPPASVPAPTSPVVAQEIPANLNAPRTEAAARNLVTDLGTRFPDERFEVVPHAKVPKRFAVRPMSNVAASTVAAKTDAAASAPPTSTEGSPSPQEEPRQTEGRGRDGALPPVAEPGQGSDGQAREQQEPEGRAQGQEAQPTDALVLAKPLDQAAHQAATSPHNDLPEPTEPQQEAGNYQKGHVRFAGLDISIENPKGSKRSGVDPKGKPWEIEMSAHYGYIRRTEGHDGEQVDVYIASDREDTPVFVVDQVDPTRTVVRGLRKTHRFDEHKVVLGAASRGEAEATYDAHFSDGSGPARRKDTTGMSMDAFKAWLKDGDTKKPIARQKPAAATAATPAALNDIPIAPAGASPGPSQEVGERRKAVSLGKLASKGIDSKDLSVRADVAAASLLEERRDGRSAAVDDASVAKPRSATASSPPSPGVGDPIAARSDTSEKPLAERLRDPELRAALQYMATQAGWAQRGGEVLRDGQDQVNGRTPWLPNEPWYGEIPERLGREQTIRAVKKAIEGKKLGGKEERVLGHMLNAFETDREEGHKEVQSAVRQQEQDADRQSREEREAIMAEAREALDDLSDGDIEVLLGTRDWTPFDWQVRLQDEQHISRFFDQGTAQGSGVDEEADTRGEGQGAARRGGEAEIEAGTLLETYTAADLAERKQANLDAERRESEKNAVAVSKRQADRDREDFVLTGSDNVADELEARGQGSLLDQPAAGNQPSSNGVRYSYLGEKAAGADRGALAQAIALSRQGLSREDIRERTGWFKGKDDRWRFEISDRDSTLRPGWYDAKTIGEAFQHDKLFQNYPALADIGFSVEPLAEGVIGHFDTAGPKVVLNADAHLGAKEARSILLHEIQHVVQTIERFAMGGSSRSASVQKAALERYNKEYDALEKRLHKIRDLRQEWISEEIGRTEKPGGMDLKERSRLYTEAAKTHDAKFPQVAKELDRMRERIGDLGHTTRYQAYQQLLGEIEARDVQVRADMGDMERGLIEPYVSQGIREEDFLIDFTGEAAALEEGGSETPTHPPPLGAGEEIKQRRRRGPQSTSKNQKPGPAGLSASGVRETLAARFGGGIGRLIEAETLRIRQHESELPPHLNDGKGGIRAVYDPTGDPLTGEGANTVWMVADNLTAAETPGVFLHDLGVHYGLERMIGREKYQEIIRQLKAMEKLGNEAVRAGRAAIPNRTPKAAVDDELLAYLVEKHPELPIVKRIIAAIRAFLFRHGLIKNIRPEDVVALAKAAARHAARGTPTLPSPVRRGRVKEGALPAYSGSPLWYSEMAKFLDDKAPGKAPAAQWKMLLDGWAKAGKYKRDELEFSGLIEYLDLLAAQQVPPTVGEAISTLTQMATDSRDRNAELFSDKVSTTSFLKHLEGFFNRELGIRAGGVQPSESERVIDRRAAQAVFLGNLVNTPPFAAQGLSFLDRPTRAVVLKSVDALIDDQQIRKSIVASLPVDVVHLLASRQLSSEDLLNKPSVFKDLVSIDGDKAISIPVDTAGSLVKAVANAVAEQVFANPEMAGFLIDKRAAIVTIDDRHDGTPSSDVVLGAGVRAPAPPTIAPSLVTKDQVLGFVRENGVRVEETTLSDEAPAKLHAERQSDGTWRIFELANGTTVDVVADAAAMAEIIDANLEELMDPDARPRRTRHATHQLPGGENYREVLLRLPEGAVIPRLKEIEKRIGEIYRTERERRGTELTKEFEALRREQVDLEGKIPPKFESSHYPEPNILAHVRFNERTDAEGKRVLFIEEIQSDWGQKGKREGFKGRGRSVEDIDRDIDVIRTEAYRLDPKLAEDDATAEDWQNFWDAHPEMKARENALYSERGGVQHSVPTAPFVGKTEAWVGLALKRMIRHAAENGFDRIAWTSGEQQAERYPEALRKVIDEIEWFSELDGSKRVTGDKSGRTVFYATIDGRGILSDASNDEMNGKHAADVFGKDMSQKILGEPNGSLSGLDFNVGGHGMKVFYGDSRGLKPDGTPAIVPNVANGLLKKLGGGRVRELNFNSEIPDWLSSGLKERSIKTEGEVGKQPGFDLTPELRASAMRGLPLFSRAETQRGVAAAQQVLDTQADVQNAVRSREHGEVTFIYGEPGDPARKFKGGFGLSHIVAKHGRQVLDKVIETVAYGRTFKRQEAPQGDRVLLSHVGHTAVLSLYRHGDEETWLLTGWDEKNPGGLGGVYVPPKPTLSSPIRFQTEEGAGPEPAGISGERQSASSDKSLQPAAGSESTIGGNGGPVKGPQAPLYSRAEEPPPDLPRSEQGRGTDPNTPEGAAAALGRIGEAMRTTRHGWEAVKSKIVEDWRPARLALATRRQLVDIGQGMVPELADYDRAVQAMDADRNQLDGETHEVAEIAEAYVQAHPKEADDFFDLLHAATLAGTDPAETFRPSINKGEAFREMASLRRRMRTRPGEADVLQGQIDEILVRVANEKVRKSAHPGLARRWFGLSQDAKVVYSKMRDLYKKRFDEREAALIQRIRDTEADERWKARLIADIKHRFETARLSAPYFPLTRFGDFWVAAVNPDGEREFHLRESAHQMKALTEDLARAGYHDIASGRKIDTLFEQQGASAEFVTEVIKLLDRGTHISHGARADLKDAIYQMYLHSLPELSTRRHWIHRKKTPGFSKDAVRGFAKHMFHGNRQLAVLRQQTPMEKALADARKREKFGSDPAHEPMEQALRDMRKKVKDKTDPKLVALEKALNAARKSVKERLDPVRTADLINEMQKRDKWIKNPQVSSFAYRAGSLGFLWYLTAPASAIVNVTQTPLVAYPLMAARHGWVKSAAALNRAAVDFFKGRFSVEGALQGEELAAYKRFLADAVIDKTQTHDLAGMAETPSGSYSGRGAKAMRAASWMFHRAEVMNREITALAAYRLARADGLGIEAAYQQAKTLTVEAHFDYSTGNKPRFLQNDAARVFLMFKQFSQHMLYLLGRSAQQSIKGLTPAARSEARTRLTGLLGMHALFAGALGMPLMSTLAFVMNALFDDEDEPWDFETELRNFFAEAFGPEVGQAIVRGPVESLTGLGIASRVGLSELLWREPDKSLEGRGWVEHYTEQFLGPLGGIALKAGTAYDLFQEGETRRALESMTPTAIRSGLQSLRYYQEGAQSLRGDTVMEDFSAWNLVGQAAGFAPAELGQKYDANRALKDLEQRILDRRERLIGRWWLARRHGDLEGVREAMAAIGRFNGSSNIQQNPRARITPATLLASMQKRRDYSRRAEGGIIVDRRLSRLGERVRFGL